MHISSAKKKLLILLLAMLPAAALFVQGNGYAEEVDPQDCLHCHAESISRAMGLSHIHAPVLEQNCTVCHVTAAAPATATPLSAKDDSRNTGNRAPKTRKIRWLKRHDHPARDHWFLIPAKNVDDTIFVRKIGPEGRPEVITLSLPPLETLPSWENDRQPPAISDIRFLGVERGVLHSAVVTWKTDKPAGSKIMYGIRRVDEHSTSYEAVLATEHTMAISPVKRNKTYQYVITARDMFGNVAKTTVLQFSTGTVSATPLLAEDPLPTRSVRLDHRFFALGRKYLLQFTADQPTYLAVGTHRQLQKRPVVMRADESGATSSFQHVPLKSRYETSVTVCRTCHEDYWQGTSHPVNIRPSKRVQIPDSYPVLSDGRITCISCHEPHASNNDARIRQASKRDLCIDCHRNYG
ncbi:hypothetical protein GF1_26630 [Desulfolithobacter dissulfuricans]|uniref:Doubled CXXCH motif domain-containing protein n=1 Tax=Desulfolithobacter dissulfuricans TaxID=2795293 RepID=A0A915XKQ2_9BACT|nr:cytochrome c3 family protein [Desulfolithobacter dissulfuricans]BCO10287.1 hypothetical protein GF1_26630 [Desulfolithobacter dissulfuricans]